MTELSVVQVGEDFDAPQRPGSDGGAIGRAGEFLPEVVLNLAKVLEVLFPPGGDGRTRDAVRQNLSQLGFSELEIEADYIPAMALRNAAERADAGAEDSDHF